MPPVARRRFLARLAALPALAPAAALAGTARQPAPAPFAPAVDPEVARRQDQLNNLNPGEARFTVYFEKGADGRTLCRACVDCHGDTYTRLIAPEGFGPDRPLGIVVTPDGVRGLNDPRPARGRVNC